MGNTLKTALASPTYRLVAAAAAYAERPSDEWATAETAWIAAMNEMAPYGRLTNNGGYEERFEDVCDTLVDAFCTEGVPSLNGKTWIGMKFHRNYPLDHTGGKETLEVDLAGGGVSLFVALPETRLDAHTMSSAGNRTVLPTTDATDLIKKLAQRMCEAGYANP